MEIRKGQRRPSQPRGGTRNAGRQSQKTREEKGLMDACDYCGKPMGGNPLGKSRAHDLCYYKDVHRKLLIENQKLRDEISTLKSCHDPAHNTKQGTS